MLLELNLSYLNADTLSDFFCTLFHELEGLALLLGGAISPFNRGLFCVFHFFLKLDLNFLGVLLGFLFEKKLFILLHSSTSTANLLGLT